MLKDCQYSEHLIKTYYKVVLIHVTFKKFNHVNVIRTYDMIVKGDLWLYL